MKIIPSETKTSLFHQYLLGSISPRPICFASTIDENGLPNLAPYSFFGVFGSKPPILIFSPARRVRDNSIKHTYENIKLNGEVVINMVNFEMVQQMSLASCEYPKGINEFVKAGFTPLDSEMVKPFRVKESPVNMECKVINVIETGTEGGAGNLIICEVVCMHIHDAVLDEDGSINPHKIDLVARMGKDFYCRASGDAIFEVPKPNISLGIGFDLLPDNIKNSFFLSGNDLGILANVTQIPELDNTWNDESILNFNTEQKHKYAKDLIHNNKPNDAWQVLLRS